MRTEARRVPVVRFGEVTLYTDLPLEVDEWGEAWLTPEQVETVEAMRVSLQRAQVSLWHTSAIRAFTFGASSLPSRDLRGYFKQRHWPSTELSDVPERSSTAGIAF